MLVKGKKLLVTGVLTDDSIAYAIAKVAQAMRPALRDSRARWFAGGTIGGELTDAPRSEPRTETQTPPACPSLALAD